MRPHVPLAMMLGLLTLMPGKAHAQTHVCGSGPGPNEVQVGETPGAGGARTRLCDWRQQAPPQLVELSGALAIDSQMHVSGRWNSPSAAGAMDSAYDACLQSNKGGCRIIGSQAFKHCAAAAADGAGRVFGVPNTRCAGAIKETMDWCRSQSKGGKCYMLAGVVDAGSNRSSADAENCRQLSLSADELKALSYEQ